MSGDARCCHPSSSGHVLCATLRQPLVPLVPLVPLAQLGCRWQDWIEQRWTSFVWTPKGQIPALTHSVKRDSQHRETSKDATIQTNSEASPVFHGFSRKTVPWQPEMVVSIQESFFTLLRAKWWNGLVDKLRSQISCFLQDSLVSGA